MFSRCDGCGNEAYPAQPRKFVQFDSGNCARCGITDLDRYDVQLPTLAVARLEAVAFTGRCLNDNVHPFWNGEEWLIEMTDAADLVLLTLSLSGISG